MAHATQMSAGDTGLLVVDVQEKLMPLMPTAAAMIRNTAFLIDFFLFSAINIYVHSNLSFPHPVFRLLNFWTRTHDVHHYYCRNNYSSIFPFWDQMFGTAEDQVVSPKAKKAPVAA